MLGLGLLVTAIKYPKDVLVKLPLEIIKLPFRPLLWLISLFLTILAIPIIYLGEKYKWRITSKIEKLLDFVDDDDDNNDKPHPATRNLKVDFISGHKYIYVLKSTKDLKQLIQDFLGSLTGKYSIEEFELAENSEQKIIKFPAGINFYDFHLFVQHFNTELGDKQSFGVYKSAGLDYYVFQDSETLNNLVGFTADRKFFSIYMLDDLEKNQHLKVNQKLKVETYWIERINGLNTQLFT
ncbi:MAG: hypothetical protein K2U26_00195 [Cyclobacteriaceae bacterium]|nr:hypothetical protein [Cyclobacteriaceae bacterium]